MIGFDKFILPNEFFEGKKTQGQYTQKGERKMQIKTGFFGMTAEGKEAHKYILTNDNGMEAHLSEFGALLLALRIPVSGEMRDVVLGFDTPQAYCTHAGAAFGAYVGRNANRIADAQVNIDGILYTLDKNNGRNNLHSGCRPSYTCLYEAATGMDSTGVWVEFSRMSPHLEQGFPGDLQQKIRYTLNSADELILSYAMISDRTTVINPTNHAYFNLLGHDKGDILTHRLTVYSDRFLPTTEDLIPTGEIRDTAGTPFDFTSARQIGERIHSDYAPLRLAGGYDHTYCLPTQRQMYRAAELTSPDGALTMTVSTDLCGVQIYTGNFIGDIDGKGGASYHRHSGICLETQFWPNACNQPGFPTTVVPANHAYESKTIYGFSVNRAGGDIAD